MQDNSDSDGRIQIPSGWVYQIVRYNKVERQVDFSHKGQSVRHSKAQAFI